MTGLSEAPAALERGRPVLCVVPPAPARAGDVWPLLAGDGVPRAVIVCADQDAALDWAAAAPPGLTVHPVTGLDRAAHLLARGGADVLAGTPADLARLVERSALKLDAVPTVVVAWPEALVAAGGRDLDAVLAEARAARRIVLAWNPAALDEFLERQARRPHVVGALPVGEDGRPLPPAAPARYLVTSADRRAAGIRDALDALGHTDAVLWRGPAADAGPGAARGPAPTVCTVLPTRAEFAALAQAGPVVIVVTPAQLPYLRSIAAPLTALGAAAPRAESQVERLRARIAARLEAGPADAELALLAPLFARYDAAEVAAAVLAVTGAAERPAAPERAAPTGWRRVWINVGKRDRATARDFVGALVREAGLARGEVGKVDVRESFATVEIAAAAQERALARLAGMTIRGRRVTARPDQQSE